MITSKNYTKNNKFKTIFKIKLKEMKKIDTYNELKNSTIKHQNFIEVSEELYNNAISSNNINHLPNNTFQILDTIIDGRELYYTFGKKDNKYYGCLCNANFSIANF